MVIILRISDLQNKDIVDIKSGEKIGNIVDIEVDSKGMILKLIIYDKKGFFGTLKSGNEVYISWQEIEKIGSDVILVSRK